MMFWSDVDSDTISSAHLNGTGLRILVNSSINVPGDMLVYFFNIVTVLSSTNNSVSVFHRHTAALYISDTMLG